MILAPVERLTLVGFTGSAEMYRVACTCPACGRGLSALVTRGRASVQGTCDCGARVSVHLHFEADEPELVVYRGI